MSFANLLFCANLLLCGVNVLSESSEKYDGDFRLFIWKKGDRFSGTEALSTEYYFEEDVLYYVSCARSSNWYLHWEVEPYGLKSSIIHERNYNLVKTAMQFVLRRDDQITIACYTKHKVTNIEENKTTTFVWNKILNPLLSTPRTSVSKDVRHDADTHKCYTKNDTETCAYIQFSDENLGCKCIFVLHMYTRINHDKVNGTETISNVRLSGNATRIPQTDPLGDPVKLASSPGSSMGWVPVVAGVAGVAGLLVVFFIIYRLIRKRRQHHEEAYCYAYADQIRPEGSDPPPPAEETSRYAKIIGFLGRKKPRVEDLVYAEILYDGAVTLQGPSPPPPPPLPPPRLVTSQSSSSPPSIEAKDISQRAPCPLPAEELEENKKYVHYDTPYEWRIWRGFNPNRRAQPSRRPSSQDIQ